MMSGYKKDRSGGPARRNSRIPLGISRRQILPTALMIAAGCALALVIKGAPVGVKQVFSVSADASYDEPFYQGFSAADVDVLKEHADAPVREFSEIAGQLMEMNNAVGKTSSGQAIAEDPFVEPFTEEETFADAAVPAFAGGDEATSAGPIIIPDAEMEVDRSGENVSSGNKRLYRSNYHYGADPLPYSGGGAGLNTSGVPMSELALPDSLRLDENGVPLAYSGYIDCRCTAYSGGGMTSTGTYVYQGCVAVDPRKIPYGTEMWIVSLDGQYVYGYCRAEDTGGFIYMESRNVTADLYMHSEADCDEWGIRDARIYFLPPSY